MSRVYDPKEQKARVNFVCARILSGAQTTRTFDSCLEMGDGDEVAANVYRRALKNPRLMEALPRYLVVDMCKKSYDTIFGAQAGNDAEDYDRRVCAYEEQGLTRSDAQAVVDAEDMKKAA